ncbi:hypothetical protein OG324_01595 [Streptomyces sp. NBC_01236]|nr:hypothetical protein OG324_01595 [Streptomyces sp. NBC_01236]
MLPPQEGQWGQNSLTSPCSPRRWSHRRLTSGATNCCQSHRLAVAVFGDFPGLPDGRRTISHLLFTEPYLQLYRTGWERAACAHVARLRVLLGRYRGDAELAAHIDHMRDLNADFARMWAEHPVAQVRGREYLLHHPVVGDLTLHGELIALPDEPSCWGLDLFAAEPGSASEQALRKLASL